MHFTELMCASAHALAMGFVCCRCIFRLNDCGSCLLESDLRLGSIEIRIRIRIRIVFNFHILFLFEGMKPSAPQVLISKRRLSTHFC